MKQQKNIYGSCIMRKIIIPAVMFCLIQTSCKKDTSTISADPPSVGSKALVVSLLDNDIVGIDLGGLPVLNLRTGQTWKVLHGTMALTMMSHGDLKSFAIYNFVTRDNSGREYHPIFDSSIQSMWWDGQTCTYKLIGKPKDDAVSITFYAYVEVTERPDGRYQIAIDDAGIDYQ